MRYLPLFDLRVRHPFYSGGQSPDFLTKPTTETEQLLRNHRSMVKDLPDGLRVLTAVTDSAKAFIPFLPGVVFAFEMRLKNSDFALITDMHDIAAAASPLYSNASLSSEDDVELELTSREAWAQESFRVAELSNAAHYVLSGKPIEGTIAANFDTQSTGSIPEIVDYLAEDKTIIVDSQSMSPGQVFTVKYPVAAHREQGEFARIEIHANDTLTNLQALTKKSREFHISFRAKQAKWAYYCVTDLANDETSYRIVDTPAEGQGAPLIFSEANRTDLTAQSDPLDDVAGELAEHYPSLKRFRFLSDESVECRQAARKNLALHVNGNKLPGALPNPSFRNFSTVRIKVGDTLQEQDWLFEIVKVLTQ